MNRNRATQYEAALLLSCSAWSRTLQQCQLFTPAKRFVPPTQGRPAAQCQRTTAPACTTGSPSRPEVPGEEPAKPTKTLSWQNLENWGRRFRLAMALTTAVVSGAGCSLTNAPASAEVVEERGVGGSGSAGASLGGGGFAAGGASLGGGGFAAGGGAAAEQPECYRSLAADAGSLQGGTVVFCDDFESGTIQWQEVDRVWVPSNDGSGVITSVDSPENPGEARVATLGGTWSDMTISGRVKVNSMVGGRRIYLAGRFQDANNWYGAALYNAKPRRVQLRKKVAGSSSDIPDATAEFAFEDNVWYDIRFELSGSELSMSVDGIEVVRGVDDSFSSGRVALLADRSVVSWDDIVVTVPAPVE